MVKLTTLRSALPTLPMSTVRMATTRVERDAVREERPWRRWYRTARWRSLRLAVFVRDGFTCQWPGCGRLEGDTSKLVADHCKPHRGDEHLFWDEANVQTLCKPCHDGAKQRAERRDGR